MEGSIGEAKKLDGQSSKHSRLLRVKTIGLGVTADNARGKTERFSLHKNYSWMCSPDREGLLAEVS